MRLPATSGTIFLRHSYKELPSVGAITVYDPFTGAPQQYQMPAGGRGYTRVPSLISLWSTAPFLLNNSVGRFNPSPSVEARMASFNDSITKMLWPEKREKDAVLGDKMPGVIDRTNVTSWLRVPTGYLPDVLKDAQDVLQLIAPKLFDQGGHRDRPDPGRDAGRSAGQFRPAAADIEPARAAGARQGGGQGGGAAGPRPEGAAAGRHRRRRRGRYSRMSASSSSR